MSNNKRKLSKDLITIALIVMVITIASSFLEILCDKLVLVDSYNVSSTIEVQSFEIGTEFMYQTIKFKDSDNKEVTLDKVLFEGDINAPVIYVWRLGKWDSLKNLRQGYQYFVTTNKMD